MEIDTMTKAKAALDKLAAEVAEDDKPSNETAMAAGMAVVFVFVDIADSLRAIAGRADD